VVGLTDPFRGQSQAAIEQTLARASERLLAQGALRQQADGGLAVAPHLVDLVDTLAQPERSYFVYVTQAAATDAVSGGQRRVVHVRRPSPSSPFSSLSIVALSQAAERVDLQRLADAAALASDVLDFWSVADQPAAPGPAVELPQADLHAAARLAAEQGADGARQHLEQAGVPAPAAAALAATLSAPRRNAALVAFSLAAPPAAAGEQAPLPGLGLLEGANGLWQLRTTTTQGTPAVQLEPCAGPALAARVHAFFALDLQA